MQHYHITDHLIMNYFNNTHLRFSSIIFTTNSLTKVYHLWYTVCHGYEHDYQGNIKGVNRHKGKHGNMYVIQQGVY